MTSKNMKSKSVIGDRTNTCQNVGLTYKRFDLLLPSSKQLMLVNSSIKYNTGQTLNEKTTSKHQLESHTLAGEETEEDKENDVVLRTSLNWAVERQESNLRLKNNAKDAVKQFSEDKKMFLPTSKSIMEPISQHIKPFSAVCLPSFEQTKQKNLTSLNNIIPLEFEAKRLKEDNTSKQELIKRIDRLQTLVQDIINGKIVIRRKSRSQSKIKASKEERTSIKLLQEGTRRSKNRSVTWNNQVKDNSSKSLKSNKSKPKLRLDCTQDRKDPNVIRIPIINPKGFMIKRKNQLKLTSNYQPIRQQCEEKSEPKNIPRYITPIAQREPGILCSKLRTKVIFVPNLINL